MNISKYKNDFEFALKNNYKIKVYYSDEIDLKKNDVNWKYPPYQIKNFLVDKIILEIEDYFKNSLDFLIVIYFQGQDFTHKIPINIPKKLNKDLNLK